MTIGDRNRDIFDRVNNIKQHRIDIEPVIIDHGRNLTADLHDLPNEKEVLEKKALETKIYEFKKMNIKSKRDNLVSTE